MSENLKREAPDFSARMRFNMTLGAQPSPARGELCMLFDTPASEERIWELGSAQEY
jgi:hypothetical protein